jgi:hypothetical protein
VDSPASQQFSGLYLLGSNHLIGSYPYNIIVGKNYSFYVGVSDRIGSAAYYTIYLKLRNQTDLLPSATNGTPSALRPIWETKFFLANGEYQEFPIVFSVTQASTNGNQSIINKLSINGVAFNVDKPTIRDSNTTEKNYGILFELWIYNSTINNAQFHGRYVNLGLNLTTLT